MIDHPFRSRSEPDSYCRHGPPPPVAFCHVCGKVTPALYLRLRSGHLLNGCAECCTGRKGKPYLSRLEYDASVNQTKPGCNGKGPNYASVFPV